MATAPCESPSLRLALSEDIIRAVRFDFGRSGRLFGGLREEVLKRRRQLRVGAEDRFTQLGFSKPAGAAQVRAAQIRLFESCPVQSGLVQIAASQNRTAEVGPAQVRRAEIYSFEVHAGKVRLPEFRVRNAIVSSEIAPAHSGVMIAWQPQPLGVGELCQDPVGGGLPETLAV